MTTKNTTDAALVHKELASLAISLTHATNRRAYILDDNTTVRVDLVDDPSEKGCALVWCMASKEHGLLVVYNDDRLKNVDAVLPVQTFYALMGICSFFDIDYCGVTTLSNGDAEDEEQQDDTPEEVQVAASSRVH
jgi:hypothetical protein